MRSDLMVNPFNTIRNEVFRRLREINTGNGFNTDVGQAVVPLRDENDAIAIEQRKFKRGTMLVMTGAAAPVSERVRVTSNANMERDVELYAPVEIPGNESRDDFMEVADPYVIDIKKAIFRDARQWAAVGAHGLRLTVDHIFGPPRGSKILTIQLGVAFQYIEVYQ